MMPHGDTRPPDGCLINPGGCAGLLLRALCALLFPRAFAGNELRAFAGSARLASNLLAMRKLLARGWPCPRT